MAAFARLLTGVLALGLALAAPLSAAPLPERNDYANPQFATALGAALKDFYARNFEQAQREFETALNIVPDNTLAIAFLNASASHVGGGLDVLSNIEEDAVGKSPKSYIAHVRLGFTYLFSGLLGRDRSVDAREELNAAVNLDATAQAAHVGLGIMRSNERSANRRRPNFSLRSATIRTTSWRASIWGRSIRSTCATRKKG